MAFITTDAAQGKATEPERVDEHETLHRLDCMAREAINHPVNRDWRTVAEKAYRYERGDQLDAEMLAELAKRGQPPIIENMIRPQRKRFMSTYHKLRLKAAFTGRNIPMDELRANALNDVNRYVDQSCNFFHQEARAVKDSFIGGIGWLERPMERMPDRRPRLFTRREDPFVMWPDPYGRELDLSDYRYILRSKWVDLDEAIEMYPEKADKIINCVGNDNGMKTLHGAYDPDWTETNELIYTDAKRKRIRFFEMWYRRRAKRKVAITPDGVVVSLDLLGPRKAHNAIMKAGFQEEETIVDQMWLGIYCGMTLIHHDLSPYEHGTFPFVQYVYERAINGQPVGWVTNDMMSLQDAVNKRSSKALHLLSTKQVIFTENAVEDDEELATEVAKPDGQIKLRQGRKIDDVFRIESNTEMGQSQLAMYQQNRQSFNDVGGRSEVAEGQAPGDVRSDRGLARLEANAVGMDAEVLEGVKSSRRYGLLIQTSNIQQFYTDDMIIQVTDDPNVVREVRLSRQDFQDLRRFHVDLVLVEENDFATSRQQQLELLANTLPQVLQFGAGWASVFISMTDLRDKEKLLEMVQQMSAPPTPEPKVSMSLNWSEMPPEERALWAMKLGMPELAKIIMQGGTPSKTMLTVQNDQAKQQSKERMEQGRLDLKAMELDLKQEMDQQHMRLDALSTSVQEETKREIADKQAKAKASQAKAKPKGK